MISVCLATFNGESFIQQQVDSILVQLSSLDELIVSDDGSTDNTIKIINSINDSRIKIYFNKEKGYVSNFENSLFHAKGDIIFLSDQDDIWVENKIEICLEHLKKVDLVVSDCKIIDGSDKILFDSFYELRKPKITCVGNLLKFGFLGCCLAFRATILKKALPFPSNRKLCTHDNWLFLIGACLYSYKVLNNKLILYRRHDNNASPGVAPTNSTYFFKLEYRLYLIFNILKRYIRK